MVPRIELINTKIAKPKNTNPKEMQSPATSTDFGTNFEARIASAIIKNSIINPPTPNATASANIVISCFHLAGTRGISAG